MNYSTQELVDMTYLLGECHRNCLLASRVYGARYPERRKSQVKCFEKLKERFELTANANYKKNTRQGKINGEAMQFDIVTAVVENPNISTRQVSAVLDISQTSVVKILHKHKFHDYHPEYEQKLSEQDYQNRINFCNWVLTKIHEDQLFSRYVLFTDECTFSNTSQPNRRNYHHYDNENPHFKISIDQQHRFSVNVWAGIIGQYIIGPYFFEGNLNGERYLHFLQNNLLDLLEDVPLDVIRRMWFMQDGAPPHYNVNVRRFLDNLFPNKWIGRGGPVPWPPRSPDLTCLDFFLWGHIKNLVYQEISENVEDLKTKIRHAFRTITLEMLENVQRSFRERIELCIANNGRNVDHY